MASAYQEQVLLSWPGKRLRVDPSSPAVRRLESFGAGRMDAHSGAPRFDEASLLLYGDNFHALSWLLQNGCRGKARLVYLDPPYNSGRSYGSRVRLRGQGQPSLGDRAVYDDRWQTGAYLQFLADRLLLLRQLMHADATLWLHCDHRMQAHLLLLLQEIFGAGSHLNTVFWRSQTMRGAKVHARYFPHSAHAIHIFRRSPAGTPFWNGPQRETVLSEKEAAGRYQRDDAGFFRTSDPGTYSFAKLVKLHEEGRLYAPFGGRVVIDSEAERVYASAGGNLGVKYYLKRRGRNRYVLTRAVDNLWDDLAGLGAVPGEDENYPTQKTERLLERIVETASRPGDLVLDPFAGSGPALAVAARLGRPWIGCDSSWRAIRTAAARLSRDRQKTGDVPAQPAPAGGAHRVGVRPGAYRILGVGQADPQDAGHAARPGSDAATRLRVAPEEGGLSLRIESFQSPELVRLADAAGLPLPRDWRRQVRAVLIDPAYDGAALRPEIVDAPAGRRALVAGSYHCPLPSGAAAPADRSLALLVVDVAGEEYLTVVRLSAGAQTGAGRADRP